MPDGDGKARRCFRSRWLPYALLLPQIAVTLVFFFWPAAQALLPVDCCTRTPSAAAPQFVGLENFRELFNDEHYLESFKVTAMFSVAGGRCSAWRSRWSSRCSPTASCAARRVYKTLLIWPYAVAPAVAGVLWLFLFNPTLGIVAYWLRSAPASTGTTC